MKNTKTSSSAAVLTVLLWPFRSYLRILAVVMVIGLYQYQSLQIDMVAAEVRRLELEKIQLENKKSGLQVQIDQLTNINRIEKAAKENFGLINSGNDIEQLVIEAYRPFPGQEDSHKQDDVKLAGVH